METEPTTSPRLPNRRAFLKSGIAVGAGVAGAAVVGLPALAKTTSGITSGDAAILRFLAAVEMIENDLWQQYNELGGIQDAEVPGGSGSDPYRNALVQLDLDMPQYIHDNT